MRCDTPPLTYFASFAAFIAFSAARYYHVVRRHALRLRQRLRQLPYAAFVTPAAACLRAAAACCRQSGFAFSAAAGQRHSPLRRRRRSEGEVAAKDNSVRSALRWCRRVGSCGSWRELTYFTRMREACDDAAAMPREKERVTSAVRLQKRCAAEACSLRAPRACAICRVTQRTLFVRRGAAQERRSAYGASLPYGADVRGCRDARCAECHGSPLTIPCRLLLMLATPAPSLLMPICVQRSHLPSCYVVLLPRDHVHC